ncbi:hypothetical protein OROMI_016128 [Orobanche minor]
MSLHDILATTEPGRFSCTVKGQLSRTNQKFLYLCCDRCHCLTSAEYGCLFECQSCHLTKIASPRYRLSLSVFDETGELEITMFGKEAEKLLNLPAENFWVKYQEDTSFIQTLLDSRLKDMLLHIEIQSKIFTRQDGNTILSYTAQSLNCQKTTSPPECTNAAPEEPSSSFATAYLIPAAIVPPPQTPPDLPDSAHSDPCNSPAAAKLLSNKSSNTQHTHPEHNNDTPKLSRGRTLKAKKLD